MTHLVVLFWGLLAFGLYPYLFYPILIWLMGWIVRRPVRRDQFFRASVTVIIAAYNEARLIERTIRNKLSQDYPSDLFDIIVVSDGSNDSTDQIVKRLEMEDGRVRLIRQEPRQGKTAALNLAVRQARGDLLVFCDANSIYQADSLRQLVCNFADPDVGYVTGKMLYANPDESLAGDGCTAYMKYENALRACETRIGSIVGVDGAIDCVRRSLYRPMKSDQLPDFVLSLDVVEQGYRAVYDAAAIVMEEALSTDDEEYRMRVRVALRGLWAMWDKRQLFSPVRFPLFGWQLASHKLLRYLSAVPLLLAAALNWALLSLGPVYQLAAIVQAAFFLLVACRIANLHPIAELAVSRYCFYFALLNWSSGLAAWRFIRGKKTVLWTPRTG